VLLRRGFDIHGVPSLQAPINQLWYRRDIAKNSSLGLNPARRKQPEQTLFWVLKSVGKSKPLISGPGASLTKV
jgi:hypothetical protein